MADNNAFHYIAGKDKVILYWQNKAVKTINGKNADKFLMNIADMNENRAQLYMAKLSGNLKRGNESTRKD